MLDNYTEEITSKINALPISMQVSDVAEFMGIARATAYKLIKLPNFPTVKMQGIKRIVIPKQKFLEWYFDENS